MVNDIMAKKIHSFWRLLLGSFITLLGFTACKTSKKAQQGDETLKLYGPPPVVVDDVIELYGPRPIIGERQPIDQVKPLYGVPPVKREEMPEEKKK